MLQLENSTPFTPGIALFPDEQGIDTLFVLVKATFQLGEVPGIAAEQLPLTLADEYRDDPAASSALYVSEMHPCKPATDIVLNGSAWAPEGRKATHLDVQLSVGGAAKTLRVFGDRQWQGDGASFSRPEPFEQMPIVYERAFGGVDDSEPEAQAMPSEERNPVGVGFLGERKPRELAGQRLPNIEDPRQLLRQAGDNVTPAGFGFVSGAWQPRAGYAGTYDQAWQEQRSPYLPLDFDPRFFNAAHPDLVYPGYLRGGEPVQAVNASAHGPVKFALPSCTFDVTLTVAGKRETLDLKLETVLLEPDLDRFSMLWRAGFQCDKKALRIEQADIALAAMEGVSA